MNKITHGGQAGKKRPPDPKSKAITIIKKETGIPGFDDITEGGLPAVGVTAIVGEPGSGKTVFALQMLVNSFKQRGRLPVPEHHPWYLHSLGLPEGL